ncbi:hypothetical protein GGQ22_11265 [Nocardioides sp. zg-579]|uniref:YfhO family protein n=1 Tax=Nocardioides marmotae TaxID=2663857 RepID=A0A6I3JC72_9ACTN|nr:hypothetical protein [Nocardioides marmotae]MCR6032023.1 hypothetical protein [Gordonia jinghuaiqii]MTB95665.1 hypothetical protein [Nocardioides marmotae]QKE01075.1 hypothetical protein HPC71_08325 [Nocardioides marmotae]
MSDWRAWVPRAWSLVLALLLLGPALGPGLLLTYDMVWVPDLPVRPDVWGVGSGLPRAVPSDAVVAVLDEVVPGALLQKAVLLVALVAGGLGARRLVPERSLAAQLVAVSVYQWNPYVAERLAIGHWPVLVGYAVLPWVLLAGRRWRETGAPPAMLLALAPLGSLSASAGVATAVALLAAAAGRRRTGPVVLLALVANLPWLVTGALHAADARTDAAGAELFALGADGALPPPLAALALGGIWNGEVVLPSRDGVLAWLGLAVLVGLAAAGLRRWARRSERRDVVALVACWVVGLLLALVTWAAPGAVAALAAHVPGGGLLRDGSRLLVLCAPLVAVLAGCGAAALLDGVPERTPRLVLAGALALLPITLLPDAALGLSGRLEPTTYPASYAAARDAVDGAGPGDVLALPLSSYRQPSWNHDRKVLDPLPRHLPRDVVASDELVVDETTIAGEDPRVGEAAAALAAGSPEERAARLADLGIGVVTVDRLAPGEAPAVAGRVLLDSTELLVVELDGSVADRPVPTSWAVAATTAWCLWGACLLAAPGLAVARRVRRGRVAGVPT